MWQKTDVHHTQSQTDKRPLAVGRLYAHYFSWLTVRRLCLAAVPWFVVTGCVAGEAGLEGTWQLDTIDASPIEASSEERIPFFTIAGETIEGFDGCNQFSGPIDRPGAISSTRRGCLDVKNMLPLDLNELDTHLQGAQVDGEVMTVQAYGDYPVSTFVRKSE